MPKLARIAPELPVSDVRQSLSYYEHKLGFHVVMMMPDGDYAIVERDDVAVHLFRTDIRSQTSASIHVFTEGLDELHAELQERGANLKQAIKRQPWGNRDFRVSDDAGNEIKFTEPVRED
jgi:uncharacterized glyoxalase superfamily protein PhnB